VIARASDVIAKPARLTIEQAASLPTVFLTAGYGLHDLAGMARGERVLIHAAAGGVGLAAVQIAERAGALVFATAGSHEKREFLRSRGVVNVFDSRSTRYAEEIRACTGGDGIDIVLNSFVGEHIPLGLSLLRPGGRFLEIGKREVWSPERVREQRDDVTYHAYDLAEVFEGDRALARRKLEEMVSAFENGSLTPSPVRVFPFAEAAGAFQYMAQARQIGKVVVRLARASSAFEARADATYLVTGGLRGLGLESARWLVDRGARSLILLGRHAPSGESAAAIQAMEAQGARVEAVAADVADLGALRAVFAHVDADLPPLRGIVHCAGVLDDALLAEQSWPRFAQVMGPKIGGASNLDALTRERALDFFVLFSSGSSLLGSPGQANYAAANAWMDALSHRRRAEGLPATAVNWGAWSDVGMAAGLDEATRRRAAARGLGVIPTPDGFLALEHLLAREVAQAGVLPIDWRVLAQQSAVPPVLSALVQETPLAAAGSSAAAPAEGAMRDRLALAPADERAELLRTHVEEQVVKVLGLDASRPPAGDDGLTDMGMDSLMAVELRNRLAASLGVTLPSTLAFEHPTIAGLAEFLAGELRFEEGVAAKPSTPTPTAPSAPDAATLDGLSPDELEASLLDELKDAGY
jgi:NAD(P)-dependent dehydrogenase (short-subunit alcohol dehydrogenase family)